jgi:hypothetical protein
MASNGFSLFKMNHMAASREFLQLQDDFIVLTADIDDCPLVQIPLIEVFDFASSTLVDNYLQVLHDYVIELLEDTVWMDVNLFLHLLRSGYGICRHMEIGQFLPLRKRDLQSFILQSLRDCHVNGHQFAVPLIIKFSVPNSDLPRHHRRSKKVSPTSSTIATSCRTDGVGRSAVSDVGKRTLVSIDLSFQPSLYGNKNDLPSTKYCREKSPASTFFASDLTAVPLESYTKNTDVGHCTRVTSTSNPLGACNEDATFGCEKVDEESSVYNDVPHAVEDTSGGKPNIIPVTLKDGVKSTGSNLMNVTCHAAPSMAPSASTAPKGSAIGSIFCIESEGKNIEDGMSDDNLADVPSVVKHDRNDHIIDPTLDNNTNDGLPTKGIIPHRVTSTNAAGDTEQHRIALNPLLTFGPLGRTAQQA